VPGSGTVSKTHFFDFSPCVDVVDPLVFVNDINGAGHISLDSMVVYAWGVLATYSNSDPGDEQVTSVTIRGKRLDVQGGRIVVAQDEASIGSNGKQTLSTPITSEFWQTEAQAQAVADSLLESYKDPRRDVEMRARGNIALLLGNRVVAPDFRSDVSAEYGLMRQNILYDGGMEVAVTAQRIPDGLVTHYKHIMAGIDLQSTIVATKKTHWKHLSAGIDLQGSVARQMAHQSKSISAGIDLQGSLDRQTAKGISGGITVAGSLTKFADVQSRALSAGISLGATVSRIHYFEVGAEAINRGAEGGGGTTYIFLANPSNGVGILDTVEMYFSSAGSSAKNVRVGTFYSSGGAGYYTCRDSVVLGTIAAGSKQTKTGLSLSVHVGDLLGIYYEDGYLEKQTPAGAGAGYYYDNSGERFYDSSWEYDHYEPGKDMSLHATGHSV